MPVRIAWTILWLGAVAAFALASLRIDRERRSAARQALEHRMTAWHDWRSWRERIIREEHSS